jgi:hypothetical protein
MRRDITNDPTIAITLDPGNPRHAARLAQALRTNPRFAGQVYALAPASAHTAVPSGTIAIPAAEHGADATLDRLLDLHSRLGLDAILPTHPAEIATLVEIAPALSNLGIGTFLPTAAQLELCHPSKLEDLARDLGIRGPGANSPHWSQVFLATVLADGEGGMHGAVIRQIDDGAARRARGSLQALIARFVAATWWCGPCELQLARDLDGVFRLLGVTPGLPDWAVRGDGRSYAWAWAMLARGSRFETHCALPRPKPGARTCSPRLRTIPPRSTTRRRQQTG